MVRGWLGSLMKGVPMHRYIVAAIIWVILTTGLASAQGPIPRESGFSGYIEVLGAYISTDSQLNTDNENKITQSLNLSLIHI